MRGEDKWGVEIGSETPAGGNCVRRIRQRRRQCNMHTHITHAHTHIHTRPELVEEPIREALLRDDSWFRQESRLQSTWCNVERSQRRWPKKGKNEGVCEGMNGKRE